MLFFSPGQTSPPLPLQPGLTENLSGQGMILIIIFDWPGRFWFSNLSWLSSCPQISIQSFPDLLAWEKGRLKHPQPQRASSHDLVCGWASTLEHSYSEAIQTILKKSRKDSTSAVLPSGSIFPFACSRNTKLLSQQIFPSFWQSSFSHKIVGSICLGT